VRAWTLRHPEAFDGYLFSGVGMVRPRLRPFYSWSIMLVAGCNTDRPPLAPTTQPPPPPPLVGTIAFASTRDGPINNHIYVMNADGTGVTQISNVANAADYEPAWSPDGNRIVFTSNRDSGSFAIFVMNADGTASPVCRAAAPRRVASPRGAVPGSRFTAIATATTRSM